MSSYDDQVFRMMEIYSEPINYIADQLNVNPGSIAGSISEEMNDRINDPVVQNVADIIAKLESHEELAAGYEATRDLSGEELANLSGLDKLNNPVLIDVGLGNIQIRTAIGLLERYLVVNPGDPLEIGRFENRYDLLVDELTTPLSGTTIVFAGLMAKEATDFFKANAPPGFWESLTVDQQDALVVQYYNLGRERVIENADGPSPYIPGLGDEGRGHLENAERLREAIDDLCFLPGTPIAMWDAPDKPIEAVAAGDLVVSYDSAGRLVPGRVSRVFTNEVRVILDLFGLMVTPGHVTLCGEGEHAGRHVPVLDILRTDGALVMHDGTLVRAATGCELGSEGDAWVAAVAGEPRGEGRVHVTEARHIRAGTRVITADGRDVSVLDMICEAGGEVGPDGWVRPCGEPEAEGQPFHWAFSDRFPAPEDYVLARSGTTLADIYAAGEWEAVPPLGEAPEGVPASRPAPNLPLALRGLDDPLAARGGAFAPSGAARAVTMGALPH